MSLYYEAAEFLAAPSNAGGSLKSRIFNQKDLKSQPAQIYALIIETCKWSAVLKEVIENATLLALEKKLTPVLSVLLVHDLLLAKRGIALPATHGLRTSVERHKARMQAEFTKSRIRRNIASLEAFRNHIEAGEEEQGRDGQESLYPRWIRINTLKTTVEEQIQTTFASYTRVQSLDSVRKRGSKCFYVDEHIPNLIALSANISLGRSDAYKNGEIIFQDKASCFPAYLLNPKPEDGLIIDTCAAPGNKTTHIAAILTHQSTLPTKHKNQPVVQIHAFEKNKMRAVTLENMVTLAGAHEITKIHSGQDFLQVKPDSPSWKEVGALLLDPSCSGSGIVGRDEMPSLHLPTSGQKIMASKPHGQIGIARRTEARKRKREEKKAAVVEDTDITTTNTDNAAGTMKEGTMIDDNGTPTTLTTPSEYAARLTSLSTFQLQLLLHSFEFPSAKKITYSTCSIHAEENEFVVMKALESAVARERGWRVLRREEQLDGLRRWPVRGRLEDCGGDEVVAEACIRANLGDGEGTMGFFVVGFVRDGGSDGNGYINSEESIDVSHLSPPLPPPAKKKNKKRKKKDEKPFDPELAASTEQDGTEAKVPPKTEQKSEQAEDEPEEEEWTGFGSSESEEKTSTKSSKPQPPQAKKQKTGGTAGTRPHTFLGKSGARVLGKKSGMGGGGGKGKGK